jgi:hypothetical protein
MIYTFLKWLGNKFGWKLEIIQRDNSPYLSRWHVRSTEKEGRTYLHYFHRGDAENYNHDHPWDFVSLILWGGYWEITPHPMGEGEKKRWYFPGSLLRRPAAWQHRVVLPPGRIAITLVWTSTKKRSWGFWCPKIGFLHWREHERQGGCE